MKSVVCMLLALFGLHAYAEESITVEGTPVNVAGTQTVEVQDNAGATYAELTAEFNLDAVLQALGIDSIAEASQYIVNPTTMEAVENTSDGWRNGDGDLCLWGEITEESRGYCVKISEPGTGIIDYMGAHHNGVWNEGETFTAIWAFVANEKAALVKVVVTFGEKKEEENPGPDVQLPEAETEIAKLEIVGRYEAKLQRYYTQGYEATSCIYNVADIAEKLGIPAEDLNVAIAQMTYVEQIADGTNSGTLDLLTSTDGWMRNVLTEYGDETKMVCGALYSADCDFFVQQMAYNDSTSNVSFIMGQMPGKLKLGAELYADLYIVYGAKAYVFRLTVNFAEPPYNGLEEMEQVGETEIINVSQQPTNDYSFVTFSLDLDAIAAALGCEDAADVQMQGLTDQGGLSDNHSANNGGWWFNADGSVGEWGTGAFFIEPAANNTWTEFHVGQKPEVSKGEEEYVAKLYLTYMGKYYEVEVHYTIDEKQNVIDPNDLHVVAERTITIKQELNNDYAWSLGVSISNEVLAETIGTTDVHFYAELPDAEPGDTNYYTDEYSCDPKPGFWLTADGKRTTWGAPSPWGVTIALQSSADAVIFNCIQFPDANQIGDTHTGSFYLANPEDGAMLKVNVIYNIVESVEEFDIVGVENLDLMLSADEKDMRIDLAAIAEALGFESEEEMLNEGCLRAVTASGEYSDMCIPTNGVTLDNQGYMVEDGNFGIYFDEGAIFTYNNAEETPTEWKATVVLCFEKDGKRYVLNINIYSEDIFHEAVAIVGVTSSAKTATYDLQGRLVKKAQKGIYIQNGVKVIK